MMTYEEAEQFVRDNPKPWIAWDIPVPHITSGRIESIKRINANKLLAYIKYLEAKQVT